MALGIESNSIAPQLIQSSGQALVQGIRQIGQQISGHLTEIQTKRDLAGLAQSLQGSNPNSAEFPVQLAQIASQHPLAVQDQRGQQLMGILGKAHGAWQAQETDLRNFQQQMEMMNAREKIVDTRTREQRDYESTQPMIVGGRLVDRRDPQNPQVILDLPERTGAGSMPFTSTPQGIMDRRTGQITSPATKEMTPSQKATDARMRRKDRIAALNQEINQFESDITSAVNQYENSFKRELEHKEGSPEALRHQKDKTEIGRVADQLKAEKKKRLDMLAKLREEDAADVSVTVVAPTVEPELGAAPPIAPAAAAAPVGPASVLPAAGEIPTVMTLEEARKLPPGTQFKSPDGKIRVR